MTKKEMARHIYATIELNEPCFEADDEHRIMINVSRGLLSIYQDVVDVAKGPNVIIADFPLRWTVAGMGKLYVRQSPQDFRTFACVLNRGKTLLKRTQRPS